MKTIEVLYSEFGNMYGEIYNAMFLDKVSDETELVFTRLNDEPYFMTHDVDMVYMTYIRDPKLYLVMERLGKYKAKIKEMIDSDVLFLLTGNALEMFGEYIEEDGKRTEALGLFDYHVEKDFEVKYASWVRGMFEDIEIIGHRNQFSKCIGIKEPFIDVTNGSGSDIKEGSVEGIRHRNFFATYLLGPFLIMNPLFSRYLLGLMGIGEMKFEKAAMEAYNKRMAYFRRPDARFIMDFYG